MIRRAAPALLVALLGLGGCYGRQYRENPRLAVVGGDPVVQMKPPSKFKSVFHPRFASAQRHTDPPEALERVVGLTSSRPPRAYPIGLLDRFEVVNDTVGDLPLVVTRCALTGVAAVYDRRIGGQTLLFENSGALWRDTLVIRDTATRTYWSAATGRALSGPLAGERLQRVVAVIARTADWTRAHPDSLFLDLGKSTSVPLTLQLYGLSPWQGVSGQKTQDRRLDPKEEVFTLSEADEAIAFTAEEIEKSGPVRVELGSRTIAIDWDSSLQAPRAYEEDGRDRRERALIPMYWFAVDRHFEVVRTLEESAGS